LSADRLSLAHNHHACDLVLGIEHEAVIQIGEDALQSFFKGQGIETHGDFFLKQGLIPPEPDARLLLNVSGHFQKGRLFEIHGKQVVLD
jgi:hypothetical protein